MVRAIEQWRAGLPATVPWSPPAVMLDAAGNMDVSRVRPLMQTRDDRPIELPE